MKKLYILVLISVSFLLLNTVYAQTLLSPKTYLDGDINDQLVVGNQRIVTGSFKKVFYRPDNTAKVFLLSKQSVSDSAGDYGASIISSSGININGTITAQCVDSTTGTVYFAYNNSSNNSIYSYNQQSNQLNAFSLSANGAISKMQVIGSKLVFLGSFTQLNGIANYRYIGIWNLNTNSLATNYTYPNNTSVASSFDIIAATDLSSVNSNISYIAVKSSTGGCRIVKLDLTSNTFTNHINNINQLSTINSIVCSPLSSLVYVGGKATATASNALLTYDLTSKTIVSNAANVIGTINSMVFYNGFLYVGGTFNSPYSGFATYKAINSNLSLANANLNLSVNLTNGIKRIVAYGGKIHLLGDFLANRNNFTYSSYIRITASNNSWTIDKYFINPDITFASGVNVEANVLTISGNEELIISSSALSGVNTLIRDRIMAYNVTSNNPDVNFNANARVANTTGAGVGLSAITGSSSNILLATTNNLIAVSLIGIYNNFNQTNWQSNGGQISALLMNNNYLYIAGNFTSFNFLENSSTSSSNSSADYKILSCYYNTSSGLFNQAYGYYLCTFNGRVNRLRSLINNNFIGVAGAFSTVKNIDNTSANVPGICLLSPSISSYNISQSFAPTTNSPSINVKDILYVSGFSPLIVSLGKVYESNGTNYSLERLYDMNGVQTYATSVISNYNFNNLISNGNEYYYTFSTFSNAVNQFVNSNTSNTHTSNILFNFSGTSLAYDAVYCQGIQYFQNTTQYLLLTGKYIDGKTSVFSFTRNVTITPTLAPTITSANPISPSTLTINFNRGNGDKTMVLIRPSVNTSDNPTDGSSYTANNIYGQSGSFINGWYVAYIGTGNSVTISNLNASTSYYVKAYEVNGTGSSSKYSVVSNVLNPSTTTYVPSIQASNVTISNQTTSSMFIQWRKGNGNRRLVVMNTSGPITWTPTDQNTYSANAAFNLAPTWGSGNKIVYNGINPGPNDSSLTVSGLSQGTTYFVKVFEYNSILNPVTNVTQVVYNTNNPGSASGSTLTLASEPASAASNIQVNNILNISATISWTNGLGVKRLLIAVPNASSPISSVFIVPGSIFASNPDLSLASALPSIPTNIGNAYVLYNGSSNNVNISGLSPSTFYSIAVIEYNGLVAGTTNYKVTSIPFNIFKTAANVYTPNSNSIITSAISDRTSILLTWTNGSGTNRIVVARQGSPVNWIPTDNNNYIANSSFGSSTAQNGSNYVVYNGIGSSGNTSSLTITNLTPNTPYFFTIYEYNTSLSVVKYLSPGASRMQTTSANWPQVAGSNGKDAGAGVIIGKNGNIYTAGTYNGQCYFGTKLVKSYGDNDIFLASYSAIGELQWVKTFGSSSQDAASSISQDASGNIFISGSFRNTIVFDNAATLTSAGIDDIFVAKLDASGNVIWASKAGGTNQDVSYSLAVDNAGNPVITGYYNQTATFGTTQLVSAGGTDVFVAKYDGSNGNLIWANSAGSVSRDLSNGIAIGASNSVYICGEFKGNALFQGQNGNGVTLSNIANSETDIFVVKYNSNGNVDYAKSFGSTSVDAAYGIAIDQSTSEAYVTGLFSGPILFGSINLVCAGNSDAFILKLDINGNPVWAKRCGGISQDAAHGITYLNGTVYFCGSFSDIATFGTTSLNATNKNLDIFVSSISSTGNFISASQYGGGSDDDVRGICSDGTNTFITGYYNGGATFGGFDVTSFGDWDAFIYNISYQKTFPSLNNGLVVWYPLNSSFNDQGPHVYNASVVRGAPASISDRNSTANSAFEFTQSRAQFILQAASANTNYADEEEEATFCAWIQAGILPGSQGQIVGLSQIGSQRFMSLSYTNNFKLRADIQDALGNVQYTLISNTSMLLNTWTHVAVSIKSGAYIKLFINGSETDMMPISSSIKAYFGNMTGSIAESNLLAVGLINNTFKGSIDDIRIYKRALVAQEFTNIMNLPSSQSEPSHDRVAIGSVSNEDIIVYPNPGRAKFNVYHANADVMNKYQLMDLSGRVIKTESVNRIQNSDIYELDLSEIPSGYYTIVFSGKGGIKTSKLIVE